MIRRTAGSTRTLTPSRLLVAAAVAMCSALPLSAQVTFNGLNSSDPVGVLEVANCRMEGGLLFRALGAPACGTPQGTVGPTALATFTSANGSFTGSAALFDNTLSPVGIEITSASGASFSLTSIDLAPIFLLPGIAGFQTFSITGFRTMGANVTQIPLTVSVPLGATGLTRFPSSSTNFTTLTGLSSLQILSPDVTIDNVNATVVPEPSTYLLMIVGLGGIAFAARRRVRQ